MSLAAFLIPLFLSDCSAYADFASPPHVEYPPPPERGFTFYRLPVRSFATLGSMLAMIEIFFGAADLSEDAKPPWQIVLVMSAFIYRIQATTEVAANIKRRFSYIMVNPSCALTDTCYT